MVLQRRYSVTGQTPPDDVGAIKSPKLQALDTSVQNTACGLCEQGEGVVRTSSKRSATQLPSPSTPSSHELPTKIARLGLEHDDMGIGSPSHSPYALSDPFIDDEGWPYEAASLHYRSYTAHCIPDDSAYESSDRALTPEPSTIPDSLLVVLPDPSELAPTFQTLPPELRHQIYLHLPDLVLPYPLIYCLSTFANKKQHPLAAVSRLIRSEALAIFYGYNTWIIKLEYKIMYDAFQDWIVRLGDGAACLRLVTIAVRGSLFKPRTHHSSSLAMAGNVMVNGVPTPAANLGLVIEQYTPPDGDASFSIDLSEKYSGGKVELVRNDGTREAGEKARVYLEKLVRDLWDKRCKGTLNGQDWVNVVDDFLTFTGWW